MAQLVGADDNEIVFTSGATESCNLRTTRRRQASTGYRKKIITLTTEHPAVLETVESWGAQALRPSPCLSDPMVFSTSLNLNDYWTIEHCLVSIMAANNEIGVLQPLARIADMCHSVGALFHTDATQALDASTSMSTPGMSIFSASLLTRFTARRALSLVRTFWDAPLPNLYRG